MINKNTNEELSSLLGSELTLVDVYASWCGPCMMLSPIIEELSSSLNIKVIKVDADENLDVVEKYRIYSIPTLLLFKDKKMISHAVGYKELDELTNWISTYM